MAMTKQSENNKKVNKLIKLLENADNQADAYKYFGEISNIVRIMYIEQTEKLCKK